MKKKKPIVNFLRRLDSNNNYHYYLHAVTFFDESGYKANGGGPISLSLDANGMFVIQLNFVEDNSVNEVLPYLSSVTHVLDIGVTPFGGGEGLFKIITNLPTDGGIARSTGGPGTTVSSDDSDDVDKPIF